MESSDFGKRHTLCLEVKGTEQFASHFSKIPVTWWWSGSEIHTLASESSKDRAAVMGAFPSGVVKTQLSSALNINIRTFLVCDETGFGRMLVQS